MPDIIKYSEEDHKLLLRIFKKKIKYSSNYYDIYKILGKCLISLAPSIYKCEEVDIERGGKRISAIYTLDEEKLKKEVELYQYRDPTCDKLNKDIINILGVDLNYYVWLDD